MASVYRPPHVKKTEKGAKLLTQPKYESVSEFPSLSSQGYEPHHQKPTMNYKGFLDETERKKQEDLKRLSLDPETTNKILRENGWEIYKLAQRNEIIERFTNYIHRDSSLEKNLSQTQQRSTQQSEKGRVYDSTIYEESEDENDLTNDDLESEETEDMVN